jgi:LmbE family N-acetylglucosaminyl deacetylase
MLTVALNRDLPQRLTILCLGAHSDDIEIGCGGALLRLTEAYGQATVHWVVFATDTARAAEAKRSAQLFLQRAVASQVILKTFRDGYFPYEGGAIKNDFEALKERLEPDVIFTHYGADAHQDHRVISELTWNTWRNHTIFEYEIPKYDGDLGQPNLFITLDTQLAERKVDYLMDVFATQRGRDWFNRDTFWSLMRLRGIEARSPSGLAEAFYCRKLSLEPWRHAKAS